MSSRARSWLVACCGMEVGFDCCVCDLAAPAGSIHVFLTSSGEAGFAARRHTRPLRTPT